MLLSDGCAWHLDGNFSPKLPQGATFVAPRLFRGSKFIRTVNIPEGIISIGREAFSGCRNLTHVALPTTLQEIDAGAFRGCCSLTAIFLPARLSTIGNGAFSNCVALEAINLPASLQHIGDRAFGNCKSLPGLSIPATLGRCFVGHEAFLYCDSIREVLFSGTKEVGCNFLFEDCPSVSRGLRSVVIPEGVVRLDSKAFSNCSSLTTVTLPTSLRIIGNDAFSGCSSLRTVNLPNALHTIGSNSFSGCESLMAVKLPASLNAIGNDAFYGCKQLKTLLNVTPKGQRSNFTFTEGSLNRYVSLNTPSGCLGPVLTSSSPGLSKSLCRFLKYGLPGRDRDALSLVLNMEVQKVRRGGPKRTADNAGLFKLGKLLQLEVLPFLGQSTAAILYGEIKPQTQTLDLSQ
jgi:hypothetical protein